MMQDKDFAQPDTASLIDRFADRFPVHSMRRVRSPEGHYSYAHVSPTVAKTFGLDPTDLTSRASVDHEWLHREDRERFLAALEQSAATLDTLDCEVRVVRPDGVVKWVRSLGEPIRLEDGTVVWDGVALDVTDRHEALEQVARAIEAARAAEVSASRATAGSATRLFFAVDALRSSLWQPDGSADIGAARAALGTLEASLGLGNAGSGADATPSLGLTARQHEIATLVAQGRSNREIATTLDLTEGTVKLHVSRILKRLGLRNRTALGARLRAMDFS